MIVRDHPLPPGLLFSEHCIQYLRLHALAVDKLHHRDCIVEDHGCLLAAVQSNRVDLALDLNGGVDALVYIDRLLWINVVDHCVRVVCKILLQSREDNSCLIGILASVGQRDRLRSATHNGPFLALQFDERWFSDSLGSGRGGFGHRLGFGSWFERRRASSQCRVLVGLHVVAHLLEACSILTET